VSRIFRVGRIMVELAKAKSGKWTHSNCGCVETHIASIVIIEEGEEKALSITVGAFNMKLARIGRNPTTKRVIHPLVRQQEVNDNYVLHRLQDGPMRIQG